MKIVMLAIIVGALLYYLPWHLKFGTEMLCPYCGKNQRAYKGVGECSKCKRLFNFTGTVAERIKSDPVPDRSQEVKSE